MTAPPWLKWAFPLVCAEVSQHPTPLQPPLRLLELPTNPERRSTSTHSLRELVDGAYRHQTGRIMSTKQVAPAPTLWYTFPNQAARDVNYTNLGRP